MTTSNERKTLKDAIIYEGAVELVCEEAHIYPDLLLDKLVEVCDNQFCRIAQAVAAAIHERNALECAERLCEHGESR